MIAVTFEPIAILDGLDRLDILEPAASSVPNWDEVHESVQQAWLELDRRVRSQAPEVRIAPGRNRGPAWDLFTYRTFTPPGGHIDPVVAGVTFQLRGGSVNIRADISGESTGDILFEIEPRDVEYGPAVLSAAREIAQRLAEHHAEIARALSDDARKV